MTETAIGIPFSQRLYDAIVRHTPYDPVDLAERQVTDFFERNIIDGGFFLDQDHHMEFVETVFPEIAKELELKWAKDGMAAPKAQPLVWKEVTVPHGSGVRMTYGGEKHFAEVRDGKIVDETGAYSPSEWAKHIANNTARNAWRDLWFKEPLSKNWIPAQLLRDQAREEQAARKKLSLDDFKI